MQAARRYENAVIYNAAMLERVKSGQSNQFGTFLKRIDRTIRERLLNDELTSFSRSRLEKLLVEVDRALKKIFDEHYQELKGNLLDIAEMQVAVEAQSLEQAAKSGFEMVIPATAQISSAITTAPLSVRGTNGGKLLEPFIKDWSVAERKLITGTIRQGFFEGQTNAEISKNIRGIASNQFRDGQLAVVNRHCEAITRTSVQHAASIARLETLKANGMERYQWLSTLDFRTTAPCQALDGKVFDIGNGPLPPLHINCRSTFIAKLDSRFDFLDEGATRASKDGPVPAKTTYYDWLKAQPLKAQEDVLGKTRAGIFNDKSMTPEKFAKLNMGRNHKPITLAEWRKKDPDAYKRVLVSKELTKQAQKTKITPSQQQKAMEDWLGEKRYRRLAGANEKKEIKDRMAELGLTQAEGAALRAYTGSYHRDYNDFLWKKSDQDLSSQVEVLRSAMGKLPDYKGVTYRRTTLPASELAKHNIGDVVEYKAFTSSSHTKEVFDGEHRLIITGKTGKKVGWISEFGEFEREVLFSAPKKFEVLARYIANDGILTIKLEEL